MGIHRLTVDVYSLQHPEEFMRSGKSFLAHLTGMYAAMEEGDASATNRVVQRWLSGSSVEERWEGPPPGERGSLTIAHVHAAGDATGHAARVREWATSTWEAWSEYHDLAREWVRRIRGEGPDGNLTG